MILIFITMTPFEIILLVTIFVIACIGVFFTEKYRKETINQLKERSKSATFTEQSEEELIEEWFRIEEKLQLIFSQNESDKEVVDKTTPNYLHAGKIKNKLQVDRIELDKAKKEIYKLKLELDETKDELLILKLKLAELQDEYTIQTKYAHALLVLQ